MLNGKDALIKLLNGKVVEFGDRYYRYNSAQNIIEWSDDKAEWKRSEITVNDFLNIDWNEQ